MHTGTQHIAFSDSGRGTFSHALKDIDCTVISLPDDLGVGPIHPNDRDTRIKFIGGLCPGNEFDGYTDEMEGVV